MPLLSSSYCQDRFRLTVWFRDRPESAAREYVYRDVSPYHNSQFRKRAKHNVGRAMAYIRSFALLEKCPVCKREYLDHDDICSYCGWQDDSAAMHPDKCDGGPNYAPLNLIRERWKAGERDRSKLGACPRIDHPDRCKGCEYDAHPDIHDEEE